MSGACPALNVTDGLFRSLLQTVDCNTRLFAESGYERLTAQGSPFQAWLTAALVIYVALMGWRLLMAPAGARLADLPMMGLKIGVVLALSSQWSLFQLLVFNLASQAPLEIAGRIMPRGDPVSALQFAYDQLSLAAQAFSKAAGPGANAYAGGDAGAAEALWRSSQALFLVTVGLFATCIAATGVLTATGPIFVALGLFRATRGLFVGWARALLVGAVTPLAGWAAAGLMLLILQPTLVQLGQQRLSGQLDPDTAFLAVAVVTIFVLVQVGLCVAALIIALGFRPWRARGTGPAASQPQVSHEPRLGAAADISRAEHLAGFLRRNQLSQDVSARLRSGVGVAATTVRRLDVTPRLDPLAVAGRRLSILSRSPA